MTDQISATRAFRAILATDLLAFLQRAFRDLDPRRQQLYLVPFVELLVEELRQVESGVTRRLILNLPPRHLKSVMASIVFPAWLLGRDPRLRLGVISHGQSLARDLAIRTLSLVQSEWYRNTFPQMRLSAERSAAMDFATTAGGGRYAASFDTGVTGRGFDFIIVDDPLSAQNARSSAERQRVTDAYDGMIASRLDDPTRGAVIVVHQRLHEDDLTGHLLAHEGWRHVSLPLLAPEERTYRFGNKVWCRKAGEALLPELYTTAEIERIRAHSGAAIFEAQYQQDPSASTGELLRPDHIRYFEALPREAQRITFSVDTAIKGNDNSSYTVFLVIASDERRHYVIDILRQRLDAVEMRDAALRLIQDYKPTNVLIEDASSGPGLHRMLLEHRYHNSLLRPTGGRSKEARFEQYLHFFVEGRIFVKQNQPWTTTLTNEWLRFPFARHDDQVDAMSQYLDWVSSHPIFNRVIIHADSYEERLARRVWGPPPPKGENPMRPRSRRTLASALRRRV